MSRRRGFFLQWHVPCLSIDDLILRLKNFKERILKKKKKYLCGANLQKNKMVDIFISYNSEFEKFSIFKNRRDYVNSFLSSSITSRIYRLSWMKFLILQCNKTQQTTFIYTTLLNGLYGLSFKDRDHLLNTQQNRSSDAALEGIIIIRPDSFPFPVRRHYKNTIDFTIKKI